MLIGDLNANMNFSLTQRGGNSVGSVQGSYHLTSQEKNSKTSQKKALSGFFFPELVFILL